MYLARQPAQGPARQHERHCHTSITSSSPLKRITPILRLSGQVMLHTSTRWHLKAHYSQTPTPSSIPVNPITCLSSQARPLALMMIHAHYMSLIPTLEENS